MPCEGRAKWPLYKELKPATFFHFPPSLRHFPPLSPLGQRGQHQAFPHICVRVGIAVPRPGAAGETGKRRRVQEEEEGVHQGFVGHGCKGGGAQALGAMPEVLGGGRGGGM